MIDFIVLDDVINLDLDSGYSSSLRFCKKDKENSEREK